MVRLQCPNKNCMAIFRDNDISDAWGEFQAGYCPKCGCEVEGGWGINALDYKPVKVAPVVKAPAKKAAAKKTPAKKAPAKKKTAAKKKAATKKE